MVRFSGGRQRTLVLRGAITALLSCALGAAPANARRVRYGRTVFLRSASVLVRGNACTHFWGFMSSQDFFDQLERVDSSAGPVFRKGLRDVEFFPSEVLIDIRSQVLDCRERPWRYIPSPPSPFGSLKFEVKWIDHLHLIPLEVGAVTLTESVERNHPVTSYRLSVKTENVPLADCLVILALSEDGKVMEQFSVRL